MGIIARLKPSHLRTLAVAMTHVECEGGELIIKMGDAATEMYLILEGTCAIDNGLESFQLADKFAPLLKGAAFGELALLNGTGACPTSARAATAAGCCGCQRPA